MINDLYVDITEDGYHEYTIIQENDIVLIPEAEALWQGFKHEALCPLGVIDGVGMENYGCRLLETRGMPLNDLLIELQNTYIRQLVPKYSQIHSIPKIRSFVDRHRVYKVCFLDTIYGSFERNLYLYQWTYNPHEFRESVKI